MFAKPNIPLLRYNLSMIADIVEWLRQFGSDNPDMQHRLIATLVTIIALILLRIVIVRFVDRRSSNQETRYRWRKAADYLVYILAIVFLARLWFANAQGLATYLGLLTAGLAVALQSPITNLVGWLFIVSRRPFDVGDRIEVNDVAGDVIDISLFQFSMMEIRNWVEADQSTGRIIHLPNRFVFSHTIGNFTQGLPYIWHEIPVLITFESDWEKAKHILTEIIDKYGQEIVQMAMRHSADASRRYLVNYGTLTPTVYTKVEDSGVMLTIRSLCDPRQRRNFEQMIWEEILRAFGAEARIDFAYPTKRIYYDGPPGNG